MTGYCGRAPTSAAAAAALAMPEAPVTGAAPAGGSAELASAPAAPMPVWPTRVGPRGQVVRIGPRLAGMQVGAGASAGAGEDDGGTFPREARAA
jgi:hypothetical protein